jgi:hypothetical protein
MPIDSTSAVVATYDVYQGAVSFDAARVELEFINRRASALPVIMPDAFSRPQ